jgi:hypothetical protein
MSSAADSSTNPEGAWTPFIVLALLFMLRWIIVGQSGAPVRIRRWYNTKVGRRVALVQLSKLAA